MQQCLLREMIGGTCLRRALNLNRARRRQLVRASLGGRVPSVYHPATPMTPAYCVSSLMDWASEELTAKHTRRGGPASWSHAGSAWVMLQGDYTHQSHVLIKSTQKYFATRIEESMPQCRAESSPFHFYGKEPGATVL